MSDTCRKRSRKSKLVLRECTVDEDSDDLQLQVALTPQQRQQLILLKQLAPHSTKTIEEGHIPVIKAINQSTIGNQSMFGHQSVLVRYQSTSPNQTIESNNAMYSYKLIDEDSSRAAEQSNNLPEDSTGHSTNAQNDVSSAPLKFDVKVEVETCDEEQQWNLNKTSYTLTAQEILHATNKILSKTTDIADKILGIYLQNTIGYIKRKKLKLKTHERFMQKVLEMWQVWNRKIFYREGPLFYKCYICERSWWLLNDFLKHIKGHEELNLTLELYEKHEVNVIAFNTRIKPKIKDIYTEGLCGICGKDFEAHILENRVGKKLYGNEGCPRTFFTCTGLRDHVTYCVECNPKETGLRCNICKIFFDYEFELEVHLNTCHVVRSDVPIWSPYKICNKCNSRYVYSCNFCQNYEKKYQCRMCFRKFNLRSALDLHLKHSKRTYVCEICGGVVTFACAKHDHVLTHSKNYVYVSKCEACEDFNVFLNNEAAEDHWSSLHAEEKTDTRFVDIIIPKSCLDMSANEYSSSDLAELVDTAYNSDSDSETESEYDEDEFSDNEDGWTAVISEKDEEINDTKHKEVENVGKNLSTKDKDFKNSIKLKNINDLVSKLNPTDEFVPKSVESVPKLNKFVPNLDEMVTVKQEVDDNTVTLFANGIVIKYEKDLVPKNSGIFENACDDLVTTLENSLQSEKVKAEPHNIAEPQIIIKNEPTDEYENPVPSASNMPAGDYESLIIKEEPELEIEEYEDDIIKLNIDLDEHTLYVKEEPADSQDSVEFQKVTNEIELDPQELMKEFEADVPEPKQYKSRKGRPRNKYICKWCDFKGNHKDYQQHVKNNCGTTKFTCSKCRKDFVSMKRFLAHFVLHGYKMLCCPICRVQHFNFSKLIVHVNSHIKQNFVRFKSINFGGENLKEYQCKVCSGLVEYSEFFVHWETHVPEAPAKASTSAVKVLKASAMVPETDEAVINESLRLLRSDKNKICNQCNRGFGRYNECKRHIIEHLLMHAYSNNMQELRCQICNDRFFTAEKYKAHMRGHAELPVYMCELCDKTFSDSSNFTKHKKVHNLTFYVCDLCRKKFQLKVALEKHMEKHQKSTPVKCEPCNKTFHFESCYRRHLRYFHERSTAPFRCIACGARFPTLREKWDHLWEVHKERKFKADCPICLKSFRKYSDVRAHARDEHRIDISLYKVKAQGQNPDVKNVIDFEELLKNSEFRLGQEETLVVLE